jgi:hypothetical protein
VFQHSVEICLVDCKKFAILDTSCGEALSFLLKKRNISEKLACLQQDRFGTGKG